MPCCIHRSPEVICSLTYNISQPGIPPPPTPHGNISKCLPIFQDLKCKSRLQRHLQHCVSLPLPSSFVPSFLPSSANISLLHQPASPPYPFLSIHPVFLWDLDCVIGLVSTQRKMCRFDAIVTELQVILLGGPRECPLSHPNVP